MQLGGLLNEVCKRLVFMERRTSCISGGSIVGNVPRLLVVSGPSLKPFVHI